MAASRERSANGATSSLHPRLRWKEEGRVKERNVWTQVWSRLRRDRAAMFGGVGVVVLVLVAALAPWLASHDPLHQYKDGLSDFGAPLAPSARFPLGTDPLGRDQLSRLIYGARISLIVGVLANGLTMLVGIALGTAAGLFGGWVDAVLMRLTDMMMAFPALLLAVALIVVLKPGLFVVIVVIGVVFWTYLSRIVRGETLSIREFDYVLAARSIGASQSRILMRHVLPNISSVIIVYATLGIATAILFEASLDYLGVGVQPPTPTWGYMIAEGQRYYRVAPWLVIFPGLSIMLTVLSFNLLGDGLRDALDPRLWQ